MAKAMQADTEIHRDQWYSDTTVIHRYTDTELQMFYRKKTLNMCIVTIFVYVSILPFSCLSLAFCLFLATLIITVTAPLVRPPVFLPVGGLPLRAQVTSSASRLGDTVARVSAVNQDSVATPMSYYVIHDSDWSHSFDISDVNRATGIVTVTGLYPSAPSGNQVNLTIVAAYSAQPGINSSSVLSIQVLGGGSVNNGVNLSWINVEQTTYLAENVGIGTVVTVVSATCATVNCTVAYLISSGNELNHFRINSATVSRVRSCTDQLVIYDMYGIA